MWQCRVFLSVSDDSETDRLNVLLSKYEESPRLEIDPVERIY